MINKYPNLNDCCIAVIGLGYVGLPLAIEFAKKKNCNITKKLLNRKIIGFDSNNLRILDLTRYPSLKIRKKLTSLISLSKFFQKKIS